jgi:hypothetical protein
MNEGLVYLLHIQGDSVWNLSPKTIMNQASMGFVVSEVKCRDNASDKVITASFHILFHSLSLIT